MDSDSVETTGVSASKKQLKGVPSSLQDILVDLGESVYRLVVSRDSQMSLVDDSQITLENLDRLMNPTFKYELHNFRLKLGISYSREVLYRQCWQDFCLMYENNSHQNIVIFCYYASLVDFCNSASPECSYHLRGMWPN